MTSMPLMEGTFSLSQSKIYQRKSHILTSVTDEQPYQRILNFTDATEQKIIPCNYTLEIMFVEKSEMGARTTLETLVQLQ